VGVPEHFDEKIPPTASPGLRFADANAEAHVKGDVSGNGNGQDYHLEVSGYLSEIDRMNLEVSEYRRPTERARTRFFSITLPPRTRSGGVSRQGIIAPRPHKADYGTFVPLIP
jgi:hypothetical protein